MSFKKKIDLILKAKQLEKLSINKMERDLGVDGTIYKGVKNPDYIPDPSFVSEIVRKYNIRQSWWDRDWETGSLDMFEPKPTPEEKAGNNKENSREVGAELLDLIQRNQRYSLIPNIILDQYKIMPESEFVHNQKKWQDIVDAKDALIKELEDHVKELQGKPSPPQAPKKTKQDSKVSN